MSSKNGDDWKWPESNAVLQLPLRDYYRYYGEEKGCQKYGPALKHNIINELEVRSTDICM